MSKTTKNFIFAFVAAAFAVALLYALPAYASEEGAQHGGSAKEWLWLVINFLVLVGVLGVFLKKPLGAYYKQRIELLEKALNEARDAKAIAEKALTEIEEQLKLKDEEIKRIVDAAAAAGEADCERHIAEGKATSEAIEQLALDNIENELRKAKELIRIKVANAVVEMASEKISRSMTDAIAAKLIDDSIARINQQHTARGL